MNINNNTGNFVRDKQIILIHTLDTISPIKDPKIVLYIKQLKQPNKSKYGLGCSMYNWLNLHFPSHGRDFMFLINT